MFFFFKQKTAYEIYQCDWSSDVCSSDLKACHPASRSLFWKLSLASKPLTLVEWLGNHAPKPLKGLLCQALACGLISVEFRGAGVLSYRVPALTRTWLENQVLSDATACQLWKWPENVQQGRASRISTWDQIMRSEEHTSELQSHWYISYAVFCLKKKKKRKTNRIIKN